MDTLCKVCDRSIIENEDEFNKNLSTSRKEIGTSLCDEYTINNINLDEVEKIFHDYISYNNKKFIFYFIRCEFTLQFDDDFTEDVKTMYLNNEDIASLKK